MLHPFPFVVKPLYILAPPPLLLGAVSQGFLRSCLPGLNTNFNPDKTHCSTFSGFFFFFRQKGAALRTGKALGREQPQGREQLGIDPWAHPPLHSLSPYPGLCQTSPQEARTRVGALVPGSVLHPSGQVLGAFGRAASFDAATPRPAVPEILGGATPTPRTWSQYQDSPCLSATSHWPAGTSAGSPSRLLPSGIFHETAFGLNKLEQLRDWPLPQLTGQGRLGGLGSVARVVETFPKLI